MPLMTSQTTSASRPTPRRTDQIARGKTVARPPMRCTTRSSEKRSNGAAPGYVPATTVTLWPHATQRLTWLKMFDPLPPVWGWVQSRSASSRMCRRSGNGLAIEGGKVANRACAHGQESPPATV